jgi:hypothetical protein
MKLIQITFFALTITNIIAEWQEGCTIFKFASVERIYTNGGGRAYFDESGDLTFEWETGVVNKKVGDSNASSNIIKFDEENTGNNSGKKNGNIVLAVSSNMVNKQDIAWIRLYEASGEGANCEELIRAMKRKYNGCQNGKFYFFPLTGEENGNTENGFITYDVQSPENKKFIVTKNNGKIQELIPNVASISTEDLKMVRPKRNDFDLVKVKVVYGSGGYHFFNMPRICADILNKEIFPEISSNIRRRNRKFK